MTDARRRRAVGPAGAPADPEPRLDLEPEHLPEREPDPAERYRREQPPHHDRGV